jgi:hypothetical protein
MSVPFPTLRSERRRTRLAGLGVAVLAAEVIWYLASFVFGIRLQAPAGNGYPEPMDIGPLNVAVAVMVLTLIGWALLTALERHAAHGHRIWLAVALLALLASLSLPLGGTGVGASNRVVLVLMHVVVGLVVIPVLYRTSPRRSAPITQFSSTVARGKVA